MLLAEVVATSAEVTATPSRSAKIDALARLLRRLGPDEVLAVVGWLVGQPRQGRIGVGWATVARLAVTHAGAPTLTVAELDRTISELQSTTGTGSAGNRNALLRLVLERATAPEAEFIRRLFTGELRQGALEGVMTEAVARAAEVPATAVRRAVLLSGDLGGVARVALGSGAPGLAEIGLQVLRPLSPMLASTATSVTGALAAMAGPASVEWKLDGVRLQVHRSGDEVRFYTRNLNDVTDRLPEVVRLVLDLPVTAAVLDAEVVGVTEEGEEPHRFQDVMSGFGREDHTRRELGMRPFFFDCLHVDGDDLIDEPLDARLARLDAVVGPHRIPGIVTDDAGRAEAFLRSALTAGHEGVMVKAISSRYDAGRRGKAWRKVKPVRTLDLVVLAAEWGHGRRRGWLSNLHLGARDPASPDRFVMVGKTFKGLTDQLLTWQTEALSARRTSEDGIVVHVRPELVIEIALDGVQVSTRYPGGVALRFARVLRYRPDKAPAEADTIEDVRALLG
jgi:DNA ligase-1